MIDGPLQDAVKSRVMQGTIRQVHLKSSDGSTLTSIISSLTPNDKSAQNENIESIIWENKGETPVDVSDFFARSRLSKLRFLELSANLQISSWDHLAPRTTLLTTLSLTLYTLSARTSAQSPILSKAQLFSILISNPNLRELRLRGTTLPDDAGGSTVTVPLRNLRVLSLSGDFLPLFRLLHQLILPATMDDVYLKGSNSTIEDVSQTLAPYMREYSRRDAMFQDRPRIFLFFSPYSVAISVNLICDQTGAPQKALHVICDIAQAALPPPDTLDQLFIDLIASTPREHAVFFNADLDIKLPDEVFFMMPNIETLHLSYVELSEGLLLPNPDGPHANRKLFPSLRSLYLEDVNGEENDWGHLVTYLAHQSSGGQAISLEVVNSSSYMPPEVMDEVEGLVEEFTYYQC